MASADVDITTRPYDQDPSAPEPHGPLPGGNAAPPTRDDLDDLFNYDTNIGDTFRDVEGNDDAARTTARQRDAGADADLGIEEEIKIRKPRRPVAKLDEERLLSDKGIPKLRRISKERLRFRGKGHEYSDVQRLLNTYQLWLDDMFPKAKFHDGLALIEKLGHKKRLKVMRQEWINEEKPKPEKDLSDDDGDVDMQHKDSRANGDARSPRPGEDSQLGGQHHDRTNMGINNERDVVNDSSGDEALYRQPTPLPRDDGGPEGDELDRLLAEDAVLQPKVASVRIPEEPEPDHNEFADDEEAMAGMW